jgi:predicted phage baseplate assembly protein
VDDLSTGGNHECRIDTVSGEIYFGDFSTQNPSGHGAIPPNGAPITCSYRYVAGGSTGNVSAQRLSVRTTAATDTLTAITNYGAAFDGADEESIDVTLQRAPRILRTRNRAVTAEDYEHLAREASTEVAVVRALPPKLNDDGSPATFGVLTRAPGHVNVIVVPDQGLSISQPQPTPALLAAVRNYLDERRDLATVLHVVGPRYLPIQVTVTIQLFPGADVGGTLVQDTTNLINAFLHPTRGGRSGTGWQVGQSVLTADLYAAIMPPEDVGFITVLTLTANTPSYHFPPLNPAGTNANWSATKERGPDLSVRSASIQVEEFETVCAADEHDITVS